MRVELSRISYRVFAAWVIGTFIVSIIVMNLTLPSSWGAWLWLPTLALWVLLLSAPKYLEARMNGSSPGPAYFSRPGGGFISVVDGPGAETTRQSAPAAAPALPEHPLQEVAVVVFARVRAVDRLDGETLAAQAVRKNLTFGSGAEADTSAVEFVTARELALAVGDTMLSVVPTSKAFRGQS